PCVKLLYSWKHGYLNTALLWDCLHPPPQPAFAEQHPSRRGNPVTVHFVNRDGEKITAKGSPGDSLLDLVINEDLDFDGFGACEGTLACSTCHLVFSEEVYEKLGPVTDEEMDMLDLAYGLTDTSRLGCQVCLTRALEGMEARVPESVADIRQTQDSSS
uniref:2Fe-2S ferredoxin-type domain-containing protein n=1 Tax=Gadus morhua TaxID=8049 RepID=A0A8C5BM31_GADMO